MGHDWRVTAVSIDKNADAEIADANMFNDAPRRGHHYVLVTVRGKKLTSGAGNLYYDVDFNLLGARSRHRYDDAYEVAPGDLSDKDDVLKGGVVRGTLLFEVSNADLKAGHLKLRGESFLEKPVAWFKFTR